jgi:hypothetical protein
LELSLVIPINISKHHLMEQPSCGGSGCHSFEDGHASLAVTDLQVQVNISEHQMMLLEN